MKRKNKTTKYILAGLFLSSMMGVTTACDPLGIEPTTKVDEERFWENPQLARSYVNNFYFISQSASGDTFQSEQWSDNCQGNYEQDWDTYRQYNFNKRTYDENNGITCFSALRIFSIKYTSLILGHPRSTLVPVLKSAAAITGSAAFFDPWIRTLPCSGLPPVTMISSISFKYSTPKRASYLLFYVIFPCL